MEEARHSVKIGHQNNFSRSDVHGNDLTIPTVEIESTWLTGTPEWPSEIEAL
jgi:hypothetical protein